MSYNESGKAAKHAGVQSHRDRRVTDPKPVAAKAPGKAARRPKKQKCFSFKYEWRWAHAAEDEKNPWRKREHWSWYETEKQRDDAMRGNAVAKGIYEVRNVTPIKR